MGRILSILALSLLSTLANAYAVSIDTTVDGRDNLYYTDWGHWYTAAADHALANPDSNPAHAVTFGGSSFNFADFDTLSIDAWGLVVDNGPMATGPDGDVGTPCLFNDCYFRDPKDPASRTLRAYSLIGIWSSSPDAILPLGDWKQAVLYIGSHMNLTVPNISSAYLFLAENDGGFGDNSGHYDVRLIASVPEPELLAVLVAGLAGLVVARRKAK